MELLRPFTASTMTVLKSAGHPAQGMAIVGGYAHATGPAQTLIPWAFVVLNIIILWHHISAHHFSERLVKHLISPPRLLVNSLLKDHTHSSPSQMIWLLGRSTGVIFRRHN